MAVMLGAVADGARARVDQNDLGEGAAEETCDVDGELGGISKPGCTEEAETVGLLEIAFMRACHATKMAAN